MYQGGNPLVSVVVITYNSSKFIYDTLESIKKQSYSNLELIVSDDCSKDDTINVVTKWINNNFIRFRRIEIVQVDSNTGIPSNCNRGILAASGRFIKIIAGDDLLLDNCIELNLSFIGNDRRVKVLHSNAFEFFDSNNNQNQAKKVGNTCFNHPSINSKQQFDYLKFSWPVNASTLFFDKVIFDEFGLYDENFKIEDWPFLLKLVSSGVKIYYLNEFTTKYRIHSNSITRNDSAKKLANSYYLYQKQVIDNQLKKVLKWHELLYFRYRFFRFNFIVTKTNNKADDFLLNLVYGFMKIPDKFYELIRKSIICFELINYKK
jgi:glycosyltransferase involved in cell wall biosynthesis